MVCSSKHSKHFIRMGVRVVIIGFFGSGGGWDYCGCFPGGGDFTLMVDFAEELMDYCRKFSGTGLNQPCWDPFRPWSLA